MKNLSKISEKKDIVTKEYIDDNFALKVDIPSNLIKRLEELEKEVKFLTEHAVFVLDDGQIMEPRNRISEDEILRESEEGVQRIES